MLSFNLSFSQCSLFALSSKPVRQSGVLFYIKMASRGLDTEATFEITTLLLALFIVNIEKKSRNLAYTLKTLVTLYMLAFHFVIYMVTKRKDLLLSFLSISYIHVLIFSYVFEDWFALKLEKKDQNKVSDQGTVIIK